MIVDWARSGQIAELAGSLQKACWRNASIGLLRAWIEGWRDLSYVEGWMILDDIGVPIPVEHGWLVTDAGLIVEPTLVTTRGDSGIDSIDNRYFPGVAYSHADVYHSLIVKRETPPLVWSHGFGGCGSPAYMAARDAAFKAAYGRDFTELFGALDSA